MSNHDHEGRIAVYPGSFDPLTNGHLDVVKRAARLFSTVIVSVYAFPEKKLLFAAEERMELWQAVIASEDLPNVRVDTFTGLTIEHVRMLGGSAIIKGLRTVHDFTGEFQQGLMNQKLAPEIETVCLFTRSEQLFVSSSLLKEIARLGGNVSDMLPPIVLQALQKKFAE